ncbi:MAG: ABC transporter permease [Deinococcales bacterium]
MQARKSPSKTQHKSQSKSHSQKALRIFFRNKAAVLGMILLLLVILASFVGRFFTRSIPLKSSAPFTPPGSHEKVMLGTDQVGRDILAGILYGGKTTLLVGISAATITIIIGVVVGALAGFYGGWVDEILMRITEFFQVLPTLLFAMVLVALFSPSLWTVIFAIGAVSWTSTARLARAEFLKIKHMEYVTAGRALGMQDSGLIWKAILPNALPPLIVSATLIIGVAILFEAGLSFLGLSDPNVISWGAILGGGRPYFLDAWWIVTLPGLMIFITVLSISLIGDGLNDAFNPKLRES